MTTFRGAQSNLLMRRARNQVRDGLLHQLLVRDGAACRFCQRLVVRGLTLGRQNHPLQMTLDEFTPVCLGGRQDLENCVIACHRCNLLKGPIPGDDFIDLIKLAATEGVPIDHMPGWSPYRIALRVAHTRAQLYGERADARARELASGDQA